MAFVAGALSQSSVSSNSAQLSSAAATGGVGPITYQWYRSTTSGFTPGAGSLIAGATALTLSDTGLIPNTVYYYEVVATDTGNGNATASSAQLPLTTTPQQLSPNQFAQVPIAGMLDLRFDYDTVSVQIDASQATPLYSGMWVKMVDSADGIPKVIGCAANSDEALGPINFDVKSVAFNAGDRCEISMEGNVIYLYTTGAISRGKQVTMDIAASASVAQAVPSSGAKIVGWAFDKAPSAGSLIRVKLTTPSFLVA
jgi:hypothetical protein